MVKFVLKLFLGCGRQDDLDEPEYDQVVDRHIDKVVEMPAFPRVGEHVMVGGNEFKVGHVQHRVQQRTVEVTCDVSLFEAVAAYDESEEGWNLSSLSSGKEIFFQRLKEYRKNKL